MKTIGIDARFFAEAGPGRYVKAIVEHLEKIDTENKYIIFLRKRGFELYKPKNPNFDKVLADYKWYSWAEQTVFLVKLLGYKLDLFYVSHFNIPILYPGTFITAIPDIIMHTFSTEKGTTLPKFYFRFKKLVYRLVVWWAVKRSKKVIVPSKSVINDFRKHYPQFDRDKYVLAYEGVDPVFLDSNLAVDEVLNTYGIKTPYLLYVSSMYEHKNVYGLIEAFKLLMSAYGFDGQLVLVGKKDKFSEEIAKWVKNQGLQEKILLPGMQNRVSDAEVVSLRKEALLYVFGSLKEGFSLTPLEAQAVGLPCVISDIDVHKEIYEDSVAYFNPLDAQDTAHIINDVISDRGMQEELRKKGYENVRRYSWENTAQITLAVFKQFI